MKTFLYPVISLALLGAGCSRDRTASPLDAGGSPSRVGYAEVAGDGGAKTPVASAETADDPAPRSTLPAGSSQGSNFSQRSTGTPRPAAHSLAAAPASTAPASRNPGARTTCSAQLLPQSPSPWPNSSNASQAKRSARARAN